MRYLDLFNFPFVRRYSSGKANGRKVNFLYSPIRQKKGHIFILLIFMGHISFAQSFEVMLGSERVFTDAQYLKFFDEKKKISLFSRVRATSEYDRNETDLFTGAYLSYTTESNFGATILGRTSSNSSGVDTGVHYLKTTNSFMVYALASINIGNDLLYSWFSVIRFTPALKKGWKLASSLELFTAFSQIGHLNSVQRVRLGLDKNKYQFGLAANIIENRFSGTFANPGLFLRKTF